MRPEGKNKPITPGEREAQLVTEDREEVLDKLSPEVREALIKRMDVEYETLYKKLEEEIDAMRKEKVALEKKKKEEGILITKDQERLDELTILLANADNSLGEMEVNEDKNKIMFSADIAGALIS